MDISNQKVNNFPSCQKSREIRSGAAERHSEQGEGCCCNRGTEVTAVQVELCLYGEMCSLHRSMWPSSSLTPNAASCFRFIKHFVLSLSSWLEKKTE